MGVDAVLVADLVGPPVPLDDPRPAHALCQVLVGRADHDLRDLGIGRRRPGGARKRVVGLELDHGPDGDPARGHDLFQQRELREQMGVDPGAGLVAGPEIVAERFDDVIGGDGDVGCAGLEQARQGSRDRPDGGTLT